MAVSSNQNNFFGIKVSVPGVNVNNASDSQLVYKNDYSAETFYSKNGSIMFGQNKDGTLGQSIYDSNGNLVFEMDGQTWYWYDTAGNTVMMVGYLPVSKVYGWAVATPGNSLAGQV